MEAVSIELLLFSFVVAAVIRAIDVLVGWSMTSAQFIGVCAGPVCVVDWLNGQHGLRRQI